MGTFIDLCCEEGLWFFGRPGPFVMAELKNEGLPYRLYTEHPEIAPVGWDAKPASTHTIDIWRRPIWKRRGVGTTRSCRCSPRGRKRSVAT